MTKETDRERQDRQARAVSRWFAACRARQAYHEIEGPGKRRANIERNSLAAEAVSIAPELFLIRRDERTEDLAVVEFVSTRHVVHSSQRRVHVRLASLLRAGVPMEAVNP